MEKIIVVNWRFTEKYDVNWNVENTNKYKIICLNHTTVDDLNNSIKEIQCDNVLILLHKNNLHSNITIDSFKTNHESIKVAKIFLFGGGSEPVYVTDIHSGFLFGNGDTLDESCLIDSKIKYENFSYVWDSYWNKLDLEYQKKKILELWLPLAIDIQGLSELTGDILNEYIEAIETDIDNYATTITEEWTEVKKVLLPDGDKDILDEKYKLKPEEKLKLQFPIERIQNVKNEFKNFDANTLKEFVRKNCKLNQNDPKFLPNWLNESVRIIDYILAGRPKLEKID